MRSFVIALVFALAIFEPKLATGQTTPDESRRNDAPVVDDPAVPTVDDIDEEDGFDDEEAYDDDVGLTEDKPESGAANRTAPAEQGREAVDEGRPEGARLPQDAAAPALIDTAAGAAELERPQPETVRPAGGVEVPPPARRRRPLKLKPPTKPVRVVTEAQLRTQVGRMVDAYRVGDQSRFLVEQGELESMRARAGVANVVLASSVLIRQAQVALSAKAHDRAVELATAAVRLSPDLVAAHWTEIQALWAQDWVQLRRIGGSFWRLLGAQFGIFRNQVSILTSAVVILGLAGLLTILAFALVQFIKHVQYPAHDIAHVLPPFVAMFVGTGEMVILLALLVLLPVAFGFGPVPSVLLAFVTVAGYQQRAERSFGRLMIVLLGAAPVVLFILAPMITFHGSIVDDMATASSEAFAGPAEQRLLAASAGQRILDSTSALILARRKRLRGDLAGADLAYQRALTAQPDDEVALTNRGVVQYLLGRQEAAVSLFERAARADRVEAILNLATIRAEEGQFETATQLLARARGIDDALAERYSAQQEAGGETAKQLFEADVEAGVLWSRLLDIDRGVWWGVAQSLWSRVGGHTPLWSVTVFAIVAFLLSLALVRRENVLSTACPKCGTPAPRRAYGFLCQQCTSVFLTAVAVEPRLRARKESEVRAYQRRRRLTERAVSMVAGIGEFAAGRPRVGALLFFLMAAAVLAWMFQGGVLVRDWQVAADASGGAAFGTLALSVAVLMCAISVRQSFDR